MIALNVGLEIMAKGIVFHKRCKPFNEVRFSHSQKHQSSSAYTRDEVDSHCEGETMNI